MLGGRTRGTPRPARGGEPRSPALGSAPQVRPGPRDDVRDAGPGTTSGTRDTGAGAGGAPGQGGHGHRTGVAAPPLRRGVLAVPAPDSRAARAAGIPGTSLPALTGMTCRHGDRRDGKGWTCFRPRPAALRARPPRPRRQRCWASPCPTRRSQGTRSSQRPRGGRPERPATHGRARGSRYVHAQSGARCAAVTGTEPLALASRARRSGTDADALADGK